MSLWFVFEGAETTVLRPDEGEFADARWWRFDEVREDGWVAFDPHLPRFIGKLSARLVG